MLWTRVRCLHHGDPLLNVAILLGLRKMSTISSECVYVLNAATGEEYAFSANKVHTTYMSWLSKPLGEFDLSHGYTSPTRSVHLPNPCMRLCHVGTAWSWPDFIPLNQPLGFRCICMLFRKKTT